MDKTLKEKAPRAQSMVGKRDAMGTYRHGFGLKSQVQERITDDYYCPIIDQIKQHDFHLDLGPLQIHLAREFGFCYGVDKAVDYAYQTRRKFPDRRIFLTAEIIHNPGVNAKLHEMGIRFLSGKHRCEVAIDDLTPEDVVILPAFGASIQDVERLRARGCTLIDTTCGSVIHVWKRVEKYAREGFTAVIHGKYSHEETLGTSSRAMQYPTGRYLVVRDLKETRLLAVAREARDFIVLFESRSQTVKKEARRFLVPKEDRNSNVERN
jgi:4-hydroxy-3-methylbut-2-enyl diphosphate reductase